MTVAYEGHGVTVHIADALDVLAGIADASVDAVVTDPPYGLEFMGKEWDSFRPDVIVNRGGGVPGRAAWDSTKMAPVEYGGAKQRSTLVCDGCGKSDKFRNAHDCPDGTGWTRRNLDTSVARVAYAKAFQDWCEAWATECLRVLKPGGHLLAFGGTRTWHRLACAVEDAGFEVRDSIAWMYGSGFPKSLDVSKAIDKRRTEDAEPVRVICRAIRAAMDVRDLRSRHLVEHFDGCHPRLIDHWAARDTDSQPALPTWEQWEKLRDLFAELAEHDAEAWRLNGRKGSPGDDFEAREITGTVEQWDDRVNYALTSRDGLRRDIPATPDAERWQGWGTALKPSFEGIVCATKPVPALARIGSRLDELEQSCIPPASGAVPSSAPTHPDSLGARAASAPASAAIRREAAPARTTPTGAAG